MMYTFVSLNTVKHVKTVYVIAASSASHITDLYTAFFSHERLPIEQTRETYAKRTPQFRS